MTRKLFIANPNATNSELDAKVVVNNYKLNSSQLDEVAEQYSEIVLDRMNTRDLEEFVYESLIDRFSKMSQTELRDHII